MDTWAKYLSRGMLTEGQLAATKEEEEEEEKKWWDTCLSCGNPQQEYKEMFPSFFFQQFKWV
jgi:hypothetical protein